MGVSSLIPVLLSIWLICVQSVSSLFSCLLKSFCRKYQTYSSARGLIVASMVHSIVLFSDSVSSAFISLRVLSRVPMSYSVSISFFAVAFLIVAVMSSNSSICLLKWWLRRFMSLYVSMMNRMTLAMIATYSPVVAAASSAVNGKGGITVAVGGSWKSVMAYAISAAMNIVAQVMVAIIGMR